MIIVPRATPYQVLNPPPPPPPPHCSTMSSTETPTTTTTTPHPPLPHQPTSNPTHISNIVLTQSRCWLLVQQWQIVVIPGLAFGLSRSCWLVNLNLKSCDQMVFRFRFLGSIIIYLGTRQKNICARVTKREFQYGTTTVDIVVQSIKYNQSSRCKNLICLSNGHMRVLVWQSCAPVHQKSIYF